MDHQPGAGLLCAAAPHGGVPDLIGMLKATPGVLGVDAGSTLSGKQVIFAWFENKKAVLAWYYSDTHVALMRHHQQIPALACTLPLVQLILNLKAAKVLGITIPQSLLLRADEVIQ